ncbi:MAG: DNA polymerase III subunit delta' [Pseudomonadota bacterium]
MTEIYPWQGASWQAIQSRRQANQLPHALLIHGPRGVGKRDFARALGNSLVCGDRSQTGQACGKCAGCRLYNAGSHPDVRIVSPDEGSKNILVEQIRDVVSFCTLSRHSAEFKVCLIVSAEAMNTTAQNTLLKTLEEPPGISAFLLVSDTGGEVLPTIRSRCQRVTMRSPSREVAKAWVANQAPEATESAVNAALDVAGGAPLGALKALRSDAATMRAKLADELESLLGGTGDPVAVSASWAKAIGLDAALIECIRFVERIVKTRLGVDNATLETVPVEKLDLRRVFALYDECIRLRRSIRGSAGRNEQMALEGLTFRISQLMPASH